MTCFRSLAAVALLATLTSPAPAQTISDDFNDGNDTGWSRYDPLAGVGNPASTFAFPAGGYRIAASANQTGVGALGMGRAGSFRNDATYTNFTVATDVTAWNNALDQGFGVAGRIATPGLGTTNGYLFGYFPQFAPAAFLMLSVAAEVPTVIGAQPITLNPLNQYRIQLVGNGSTLIGQAFDLAAPNVPLFSLSAVSGTFPTGVSGLISVANGATASSDATFDNYFSTSAIPEPGTMLLTGLAFAGGWVVRRRKKNQGSSGTHS